MLCWHMDVRRQSRNRYLWIRTERTWMPAWTWICWYVPQRYMSLESHVSILLGASEPVSQFPEECYLLSNSQKSFYSPAWIEPRLNTGPNQWTCPFGKKGYIPFGPDIIQLQSKLFARLGQKYLSTCLIIIIINS